MQAFFSRKNKVLLLDSGIISKTFCCASACINEAEALLALDGMYAPRLVSKQSLMLELEHIKGDLLLDRYLSAAPKDAVALASMLADAISSIYTKLNKIPYDENFRNYIVSNKNIIRIDFEEAAIGSIELWCAQLAAYAALYNVTNETKTAFITTLEAKLPLQKDAYNTYKQKELQQLATRWQAKSCKP